MRPLFTYSINRNWVETPGHIRYLCQMHFARCILLCAQEELVTSRFPAEEFIVDPGSRQCVEVKNSMLSVAGVKTKKRRKWNILQQNVSTTEP